MRSFRDLHQLSFARITFHVALLTILALLTLLLSLLAPPVHAQNFAQPKVIPTGNWPRQVLTGDFDGDGNPDLLYLQFVTGTAAGQNDTLVKIAFGDGAGNFSAPVQQGTLNSTISLVVNVADVNGDGITDMFYAQGASTGPSTFGVWFGDRSRTLQTPSAYTQRWLNGNSFSQIVGFSLNTYISGDPTLIVLDSTRTATVFTYTLGLLRPVLSFALPDGAGPAVSTDVNRDGVPDLVVLGQPTGTIDVFLTSGRLDPYSPPLRFPITGIHSFILQDVNFDGIPDLIAEGPQGRIDVYPGNGDGTFQTQSLGGTGTLDGTTGNGGHLIAVGDLNHDGLPDALTVTPAGVSALLGQGTAYLGLKGIYNAGPTGGSGHPSYVTADFNNDGYLDLAVDSPEGIALLFGNPDGSFQTSLAFAAGAPALSSALGAFTASGHLDAAVATAATQAQLLFGQGDGTFVAAPAPTSPQPGLAGLFPTILAADTNHDGKLDLILAGDGPSPLPANGSGLAVQLGDGQGNFAPPAALSALPVTSCAQHPATLFGISALADFNGDGFPDLANRDFNGFRIFDTTTATPPPTSFANLQPSCSFYPHNLVLPADFNNDGKPDLVFQSGGHLQLFVNTGAGQFSMPLGDLAVDGSLTTRGQLTAPDLSAVFSGPSYALGFAAAIGSATTADLDRDGNQDLLVVYADLAADRTAPTASAPNFLYIWFGDGTGHFPVSAAHPVNPVRIKLSRNFYQVAVADLNRDGIPDLILSDGYLLSVQLGLGDGTFGPETHYLAGQGINTISIADLNADGAADLVLANGGAVFNNPAANLDHLATNPGVNTGGITVLLNKTAPHVTPLPSSLSLMLCVDDPGSLFPCGNPLSNTPLISPITMYYGQVLDGVAVESGTNLTGTITFYDGTRVFCIIPANLTGVGPSGNACPTNSGNFHAGNRTVDAVYSGDTLNAPSTSNSIVVKVFPDSTNATLTSSLNPAGVGQPVTFTVKVTGNFAIPVGIVNFFDGPFRLGGLGLDSTGQGTFTTSSLAVGSHPITVAYGGTSDFNSAVTAVLTQIINPAQVTGVTGTLRASPEPSVAGAAFTLTATLAAPSGSSAAPTGTVAFSIDGAIVGQATLSGGVAILAGPSALAVGTHALTAAYSGDSNYLSVATLTGTHTVILSPTATLLVAIGATTIYFNQPANSRYYTTVADPNHPPTGTVTVQDNGVSISYCTAVAYGSTCPYAAGGTNRLTVGTHSLVVLYNGDSFNAPSVSPPLVFTVLPDLTTATLTSSANPAALGTPVTFTATLAGNFATPTGSVTFLDGATTLATVLLDASGNATFTSSTLALGTHPITVVYAGVTNFNPATSAVLNQVITQAVVIPVLSTFTLTVTPSPITVAVGRSGLLLVTVTGNGTFAQPVQLTCSTTTPETSCDFILPTIPAGGGSTTLALHTSAPHDCGDPEHPYYLGSCTPPPTSPLNRFNQSTIWSVPRTASVLLPSLLFLGLGFTRARRRLRSAALTLVLLAASLAGFSALSGCGRCTDLGTQGGRYTFTVTATAQGGPVTETQSQTIPITITIP